MKNTKVRAALSSILLTVAVIAIFTGAILQQKSKPVTIEQAVKIAAKNGGGFATILSQPYGLYEGYCVEVNGNFYEFVLDENGLVAREEIRLVTDENQIRRYSSGVLNPEELVTGFEAYGFKVKFEPDSGNEIDLLSAENEKGEIFFTMPHKSGDGNFIFFNYDLNEGLAFLKDGKTPGRD